MADNEFTRPTKVIRESRIDPEPIAKQKSIEQETLELDRKQKNLVNVYKSEPQIAVSIAPSYAKHFGRVMSVAINGVIVSVRCDGSTVKVPESFAAEIHARMQRINEQELRAQKNVKSI
jgi:hypothetical protein